MEYEIISQIFTLVIVLIVSSHMIYIGVRQIRRVPFIIRGFSTRAAKVLPGVMIFSVNAINWGFDVLFSVIALFLIILFFWFLYIDYKKYYILHIYNIQEETLRKLIEEYFKDKDIKVETIDRELIFDLLYNEVKIYKSKYIKNSRVLKRDLEKYISHMKLEKFRVMGLANILFGVTFLMFFIYIFLKVHK